MTYLRIAFIAVATVAATMLVGWWSAAVVGVVSGLVTRPGRAAVLEAGCGAALGWAAILAGSAANGPVWAVAQRVGPVFGLPAVAFLAVTLAFPALLAGSAALLAGESRKMRK